MVERITTSSLPHRIHRAQSPTLPVLCGVGRGSAARVTLVPLTAMGTSALAVTTATAAGFGWFVSWISSVVILGLFPCPAAQWWGRNYEHMSRGWWVRNGPKRKV